VSDLKAISGSEDAIHFERALAEYRESAGDFRDYADLPIEVQSEIRRRAHQIKVGKERGKKGLKSFFTIWSEYCLAASATIFRGG
jgi:hypothetical protein